MRHRDHVRSFQIEPELDFNVALVTHQIIEHARPIKRTTALPNARQKFNGLTLIQNKGGPATSPISCSRQASLPPSP